jgi:hypothetical protein
MSWRDLVIGRNGDSLGGRVLDRGFTITTDFGQSLRFKTRNLCWIHFRNPPQVPQDEIWTMTDDRVRGALEGRALRFKPEGQKAVSIPYAAIHTLIVNQAFSARRSLLPR